MNLAPIILFAYNRPWHTEQVLAALKKNQLADQSHLIIFVDGPKAKATAEQLLNIEEVRKVVQKDKWCGSVEYHISETNIGCRDSIISGISQTLEKYEAAIILEDDIVTSPYFLQFMNTCIHFYKEEKAVFSISGMNLPEHRMSLPDDYDYDVYVSLRQLNSGWATWKDRWQKINWSLDFLPAFLKNKNLVNSYSRGGDDLVPMLIEQVEGKTDAWDIQFTYNHFIHHAVSILPRYSYINNIGGDGSGTHHWDANADLHFDLSKAIKEPRLLDVIYEDKRIINAFYNAFCAKRRPIWQKAVNRLSRMFGGENLFVIKKKIYE
ncbi:MAG: glycosyltransferase family 25 protein [Bacteroidales bacterium]|nr:glycosyltransferase family 25 protein [Bacteroidales bacterium]